MKGGRRAQQRAVTMHDVAERAGVSTATVSRALSGRRRVDPEVMEQVRRAAADLGYVVDPVGRSLRRQFTDTVGLVVADISNPFFPSLVKSLETAMLDRGLGLLLADAANDVERERAAIRRLLARRVDALVVTPVSRLRSRAIVVEAAARVPVVQLDRSASAQCDYVGMDNARAVDEVVDHLLASGRRRPVFVGSAADISTTWERQRAFVRRMEQSGETPRTLTGEFSVDWGRTAVAEVLDRWPDVDSLICADDLIAVGAMSGLGQFGLRVPDDIAVVGFDDTVLSVLHSPTLTTIRQPLDEMASAAVDLAVAARDSVTVRQRRTFAGQLIVRDSSRAGQA